MAVAMLPLLLAIALLGFTTGLRTFTPMAALCWFARLDYLPVDGTWAAWTSRLWVALLFTAFALGELVGDKLPRTPKRTSPAPLLARTAFGSLAGAIVATAVHGAWLEGLLLGAVCALAGAYAGYMLRREIVQKLACPDWPIAVAEDVFTILAATFALHVITG